MTYGSSPIADGKLRPIDEDENRRAPRRFESD